MGIFAITDTFPLTERLWQPKTDKSQGFHVVDWMYPLHSYVKVLGSALQNVTGDSSLGCARIQFVWCPYKKRWGHRQIWRDDYVEDTGRRWPSSISQGERPPEETTVADPWSWIFNLQNHEKLKFCCVSHLACGILLWQPSKPIYPQAPGISKQKEWGNLASKRGIATRLLSKLENNI